MGVERIVSIVIGVKVTHEEIMKLSANIAKNDPEMDLEDFDSEDWEDYAYEYLEGKLSEIDKDLKLESPDDSINFSYIGWIKEFGEYYKDLEIKNYFLTEKEKTFIFEFPEFTGRGIKRYLINRMR